MNLNKRFYGELSDWYFWAMDNVRFTDDKEKDNEVRKSTNLIRLIIEVIFIWFIKEMGLVSEKLFDEEDICNLFKDISLQSAAFFKSRESEGLVKILNSYKFTITENPQQEENIAPDPEFLGKVFENLLAINNSETKENARKQSGSFYTSREIVNYMVDESLAAYLREKVGEDWENNKRTVGAIDKMKILDPACGAGAFPMGILRKMAEILRRLDPDNKEWRKLQEEKATGGRRKEISDIFENNPADYGRKFFLMENNIFGVDIQPIAVQISKLRFFLSLVTEQKIDGNKDRPGTFPLPDLETKFAAADILLDAGRFDAKRRFGENDGFDIVIGNPPYIRLCNDGGKLAKRYECCNYETFARTGDIYCLFYNRGYQLLKPRGRLCFITSDKWMRAGYGENTRKFFAEKTDPELLIDFAGVKVFESAMVDTNILMFLKDKNRHKTSACVVKKEGIKDLSEFVRNNGTVCGFKTGESWAILSPIEQRIKAKIEAAGTPLKDWDVNIRRGVVTGRNEAFIIGKEKKDELIRQDRKSAEIIGPILRGKDIRRYRYDIDKYLIAAFPSRNMEIDAYPAVKRHLLTFGRDRLEQTGKIGARKKTKNKWFETQDGISYWEDFYKPKIVYGQFRKGGFAFDEKHCFLSSNEYFITSEKVNLKVLLALLNSKICYFYGTTVMNSLRGATTVAQKDIFVKIPLPRNFDKQTEQKIEKFLSEKNYQKIDMLVYELYGLGKDESEFIEKL
jgi:hypothetical protein